MEEDKYTVIERMVENDCCCVDDDDDALSKAYLKK
jgi:hypothetical protein